MAKKKPDEYLRKYWEDKKKATISNNGLTIPKRTRSPETNVLRTMLTPELKAICLLKIIGPVADGWRYRLITPSLNVYGINWGKTGGHRTKVKSKFLYCAQSRTPFIPGTKEYREAFFKLIEYERLAQGKLKLNEQRATPVPNWERIKDIYKTEILKIIEEEK